MPRRPRVKVPGLPLHLIRRDNNALPVFTRKKTTSFICAHVLPSEAECASIFNALGDSPQPAAALVAHLPPERQAFVFRALVWMVKLNVLQLVKNFAMFLCSTGLESHLTLTA